MLEGLAWIRDNSEAYCVTFVQGLDETELLRRFGGDLAWTRLARYDDREASAELQMLGDVVRIGVNERDGWAFVYEDGGYRGTLSEVLRPLSTGTVAVSVHRNINALTRFCYAEEGAVIADFEPGTLAFEAASPHVQVLMLQAGMTRVEIEKEKQENRFYDTVKGMSALAEAAGVRMDRASIAEKPLLTSVVKNPVSEFVADVLEHGANEQTADRLFAILRDEIGGYGYQDLHQGYGWNLLALLHHALPDKRRHSHAEEPHLKHLREIAEDLLRALLSARLIPDLFKALDEEDQEQRAAVIELLSLLVRFDLAQDNEATQEHLLALASDPEPLLKTLAELQNDALVSASASDYQREQLSTENQKLQLAVSEIVKALIKFDQKQGSEEARKHLLALCATPDAEVASSAAIALGTLEDQRAIGPLLEVLDRFSRGEEAANFSPSYEREAIQLLGRLRPDNVKEHLLRLLRPQSEGTDLQQNTIQQDLFAAMKQLGAAQAMERMLPKLNPQARQSAFQQDLLTVLVQIGGAQVMEQLPSLLNPQPQTQYESSFQQGLLAALAQTDDAHVVEPLLKLLNPRPEAFNAYHFQLRLLEALGNLGEKGAIEPLARLLNPDAHHTYEWGFQEYLTKTLRKLGDSRAELQVVEQACQQRSKTTQGKGTGTLQWYHHK